MSLQAIKWAAGQNSVKGYAKAILIDLAERANKKGECWPSQRAIAERLGISVRTVERAIVKLRSASLVASRTRTDGQGHRISSVYSLQMANSPTDNLSIPNRQSVNPQPTICQALTDNLSSPNRQIDGGINKPTNSKPTNREPTNREPTRTREKSVSSSKAFAGKFIKLSAGEIEELAGYYPKLCFPGDLKAADEWLASKTNPLDQSPNCDRVSKLHTYLARRNRETVERPVAQKPRIPIGAVDLGDGRYLSRWGGGL